MSPGGDRTEQLVVFAGLAREFKRDAGEQLGELLRRVLLRGFFLGERGAHLFEALHVAGGRFDGAACAATENCARSLRRLPPVAAISELFDIFLKMICMFDPRFLTISLNSKSTFKSHEAEPGEARCAE